LIFKELPDFTRLASLKLQATLAPRCTPLHGAPPEGVTLTFASPSETLWSECGPVSSSTTLAGPARNPPSSSLEFVQRSAPPPTSPPCVHSQCCSGLRLPYTFDRSIPSNRYVPFSPFLTTSTVCSAQSFTGLLHPAASHGVRPVSHHFFPLERPTTTPSSQKSCRSHHSHSRALPSTIPVRHPKMTFRSRRSSKK